MSNLTDVASFYEYASRKGNFGRLSRSFFKAGDVASLGGAINPVYGALVYDQVNREANIHGVLKKANWERSGFRYVATDPTVRGYGGADPGVVGASIDFSPQELSSIPGFLHSPFDMTLDAGFRGNHDDGMDVWDWLVQINRDNHAQLLNEELLRDAEAESAAIGDVAVTNAKNEGDSNGVESIDRFVSSTAEATEVQTATGASAAGHYDVYEGDVDRAANEWEAHVFRPDGSEATFATDVAFAVGGFDAMLDRTEDFGADPASQVLITGRDTRRAFYNTLQDAGRYDLTDAQAKLNYDGLSVTGTHPGRDVTYTVKTYQDRPIIVDRNVAKDTLSRAYLLDQRHHHIKVGFPTLYVDVDNPIMRGQFDTKALYLTAEQTYQTRPNTSAKLRSIA